MATSALIGLFNASVTFEVAGQGLETDSVTGNVRPVTDTLLYKAFLKASKVDPAVFPGVDATGTIYEGYVIDPQELDARVGGGSIGTITFGSAAAKPFEVLKARMGYGDQGTLGAVLSTALGTKITLLVQDY